MEEVARIGDDGSSGQSWVLGSDLVDLDGSIEPSKGGLVVGKVGP